MGRRCLNNCRKLNQSNCCPQSKQTSVGRKRSGKASTSYETLRMVECEDNNFMSVSELILNTIGKIVY